MNKKYFSMTKSKSAATINIYGDITSFPWFDGDVSASNLSKQLEELTDVEEISVYINSYGGEVAEGLAIYNALKRHKAKIKTYCDGFAASIASVIFMAGDERIMNDSSLLMIHNAWSWASGNANQLRKQADDLEKITKASITAYKAHSTLSEEEIKELLDAESWILPEEAIEYGFATAIEKTVQEKASQNARMRMFDIVKMYRASLEEQNEEDSEDKETSETTENPDTDENTDTGKTSNDEEEGENVTPDDDSSEDEENKDSEEVEKETTDEEESEETNEAAQMWSGFFNAISKM